MLVLYAIPYSPWSEKARWSLLHCGVEHRERSYQSIVGALPMRARTGRWTGRISVPLAIVDKVVLADSFSIAKFAARDNDQFMPSDQSDAIEAWNRASERIMAAGRRSTTHRVMGDPPAIRAAIAEALPAGHLMPSAVGRSTARWLLRKYASETQHADDTAIMRTELLALRSRLRDRRHLLDGFTYADVTMASALQFVRPPDHMGELMPTLVRPHWCHPELAQTFEDLLDWRDEILSAFRKV